MEKGQFIRITPFIHVPDIDAAVRFFESLGFTAYFKFDDYAYVQRESAGVRLLQNHGDDGAPRGTGALPITSMLRTSKRSILS